MTHEAAIVELREVSKVYRQGALEVRALRELSLEISPGEFTAICGPSGSGKTTLLRCIAGLHRMRTGLVQCGEDTWQDGNHHTPTHQRALGYVFQEPSLFYHLNVRQNICFARQKNPPNAPSVVFDDVVAWLGLGALLHRNPQTLSGGEQQRVAVARALLAAPKLLLLDEPLSSLDVDSKEQIAPYLAEIHRRTNIPVLYVTHAPSEVVRLATEIVYIERGQVRAHGAINDVLTRADLPLCRHEDAAAALDLPVVTENVGYDLMHIALGDARFSVARRNIAEGATVRVVVRARDVAVARKAPEASSIQNRVTATVLDIHEEAEPAHRLVRLSAEGSILLARVTAKTVAELALKQGDEVFAQVKSVALAE